MVLDLLLIPGANGPEAGQPGRGTSVTRAFLFSDLRGYTEFGERHGDAAAAELLGRYRILVRRAIERFHGAEIRTEGDGFYVVFDSVSDAVRCGLEIVRDAAEPSERPEEPIRVGVGINAGETADTAVGYVGSSVNIAARICAQAAAGEVLVSETVRALTRTVLPVEFESRGRRRLKGVADPVALFSVTEPAAGAAPRRRARSRRDRLATRRVLVPGALVAIAAIVGVGWWVAARPAAGLPAGPWHIGLSMPLTGEDAHRGLPVQVAAQLAVDTENATGDLGTQLVLDVHDDVGPDPNGQGSTPGAAIATTMVDDPMTIAAVGPWFSAVGLEMIPVTNETGLLQCSPANTSPGLTKPRFGALDVRSAYPDRINYVRISPSDDIQAIAQASFAFHDLELRSVLVIDDTQFGKDIADGFTEAFAELGGQAVRLALNPGADPQTVLAPLASDADAPSGVFFGGITETGAAEVRTAMVEAGFGSLPFVSWDGILDGSGADDGSYIQRAGDAAVGSFVSNASLPPATFEFADAFRQVHGSEPDQYAGAGYACVEIIADALRAVAATGPTAAGLREAVRAHVVDPSHRHETVLGSVSFDANGDATRQYVSFYRVEASGADGTGDWVVSKQQDFGPAP